ncbi:cation channel sperm-associated auxiliary subunit delta isoform X2 [Tamandua tetradactyla]|uniref:cation channel sperm-associated auxiliary subunit delta isoform X2 n=1 Tax=Tamandua tetradactyla TaxID=48850 RepID=UPI0040548CC3
MLVLMLVAAVAAATGRLCPLARAQPLCGNRIVRTGKVFKAQRTVQGDRLYFPSMTTRLIKHPCKKNLALYLGRQVFFTDSNFGTSLLPFSIPQSMQVGVPEVTSALFAGSVLLLVINQKVYVYDYEANSWNASIGIEHPISHISGDNCCYSGNSFCLDISKSIFAYLQGEQVSQANIYFSNTWGYKFQKFTFGSQTDLVGSLGGIFYFHSLSQVGIVVAENNKAKFRYSDHPLNRNFGLPFNYTSTLDILLSPGQRGILILWDEKSLMVSQNADENELAVLTRENHFYYGSLGILSNFIIKFADQDVWSKGATLMFDDPGILEILTPVPDALHPAFDFQLCFVNIQEILMDPMLHVDVCKIELLQGEFEDKMYTIDMNSKLELSALMIPRPGKSPIPIVTVSNPHSLGLQAITYEDGYTYDGNTRHRLNISLKQQQRWGRADTNFMSSIKQPTMSTITLDVANKEISCVDLKPLTALISLGCDQDKKLVIQNKISACSKGVLDPVALQDNYSYIIERASYDPNFLGQKAAKDLVVPYRYDLLGCPRLVYYDTPWQPVVELWKEGKFQEFIDAEFVLLEVNGLFTYTYSLTAQEALCTSQPQNWSTVMGSTGHRGPLAWSRENYVSCHEPNDNAPLMWPHVPYEIMGGSTSNKIIFDQRNGIYIFFISIVDPYYSYCHLKTTFSVYVYGAFPPSVFPAEMTIALLTLGILLAVWLTYMVPKTLHTEVGNRLKQFWVGLSRPCKLSCPCLSRR